MNTLPVLAAAVVFLGLSVQSFAVYSSPFMGWALLVLFVLWMFLLIDTAWEEATGGDSPLERVRHRIQTNRAKRVKA